MKYLLMMLISFNVFAAKHGDCVKVEIPEEYSIKCSVYGIVSFSSETVSLANDESCCPLCPVIVDRSKDDLLKLKSVDKKLCEVKVTCIRFD